ncbi:MAG TPA: Glu/Leu/Phe/Val dehydrogenase dimerization domain-containing protein [Steroidobacter sp.]|jgi:leucine dehydrogenase|nr:Glu/Leu/Phe/Val dehydrogenase dimerization domain-containing protein [Steroidobacteraceae bacterium]HLS80409.1 Glu/Leu/Phe/Val dehydrogenase dimerization domain-containing protein [Steroidobacter sp.]
MFDHPSYDAHERVHFAHDAASGLRAIIALHSTARGPGAGGCRFWSYASSADALTDALRLSRGMSYKNALADLPLGGGKAVVLLDPARGKTPELLRAFGRLVQSLGGAYVTAEDVGASVADMEVVASETAFVSGLPRTAVEGDGNPSPKTALGVFLGLKAAVRFQLGRNDLDGLSIAVQGLGGVGYELCRMLAREGAKLRVADIREQNVRRACTEFNATAVSVDAILFEDVDVLAPCALGAVFDETTIARVRARVIAGSANNQLAAAQDGARLQAAGILYAPDYVINAGGIISAGREYLGGADARSIEQEIRRIPVRLTEIFERAHAAQRPTSEVADEMARERLRAAHSSSATGMEVEA